MRPLTKINQLLSEKLDIKDNNFTKDHSPKEIASRNLSNKKNEAPRKLFIINQ
jgi:hypothetical protein